MAGKNGYLINGEAREYVNLESLKFEQNKRNILDEFRFNHTVATGGAGATVEVEEKTGTAITRIGKTELTMVCAVSANDTAYYGGETVTMVYKDQDGIESTAVATISAVDTTTEVAFVPAVSDYYCMVSLTASKVADTGESYGVGTTGVLTYGVIAAAATVALGTAMFGVGSVYGRYSADNAAHNAETDVATLYYVTPWGEVKGPVTFTTAANSTTEAIFLDADGNNVQDFYRRRSLTVRVTPHATATFLLTDAACGNVDGSGSDVWAMVEESNYHSIHSGYFVPEGVKSFIAKIDAYYAVIGEYCTLTITFTPVGGNETTMPWVISAESPLHWESPFELEPETEIKFSVVDDAATGGQFTLESVIVEATDKITH